MILSFERLLSQYSSLPTADIRLVEGAGGLAVPIQHSPSLKDWADFAKAINVKMLYLVVENRLGAIHHIRVLDDYVQKRAIRASFILNTISPQPADVLEATRNIFLYAQSPLYSAGFSG